MEDFVRARNTLKAPVSDTERQRLAQEARLKPDALPHHRSIQSNSISFKSTAHDAQQPHRAPSEKSLFAASDLTDTSTNFSQRGQDVNNAVPMQRRLEEATDGVSGYDGPSDDDDDGGVKDENGEFDYEDEDLPYQSINDAGLQLRRDEHKHGQQYHLQSKNEHYATSISSDIDPDSYPNTTSGKLTNKSTKAQLGAPLRSANGHADDPDAVLRARSIFKLDDTEFQPMLGLERALTDIASEKLENQAAVYKQQNVREYRNAEKVRREALQQQRAKTPNNKRSLLVSHAGSPVSHARSTPMSLQRPQSVPLEVTLPIHDVGHPTYGFFDGPRQGDRLNGEMPPEPSPMRQNIQSATLHASPGKVHDLDYDVDTLFRMDYKALQQEPFDTSRAPVTGTESEAKTLAERLELLLHEEPAQQQDFLCSLTMEDWENSGAWFEQKFSQLTQKLRKSRQERRALAQKFEDEVTSRYEAVVREQRNLDEMLKSMKSSGTRVLQLRSTNAR